MASKADFITRYRNSVAALLNAVDTLRAERREWDALGYSGAGLVAGDFTGANADLSPTLLGNAVTSAQAVDDLLTASGNAHFTNLYKVGK